MILDEPTAALGVKEGNRVLQLIRDVRDRGLPVILISHNMPHVFEIADRIHIQRLGRRATVITPQSHSMSEAVAIMTGAAEPPPAVGLTPPPAAARTAPPGTTWRPEVPFAVLGPGVGGWVGRRQAVRGAAARQQTVRLGACEHLAVPGGWRRCSCCRSWLRRAVQLRLRRRRPPRPRPPRRPRIKACPGDWSGR